MKEFTVGKNDAGQRLDRFVGKTAPMLPASLLQKYIRQKDVKVNGRPAKASADVKEGDVLEIQFGTRPVKVEVLSVKETVRKEEAKEMFKYL